MCLSTNLIESKLILTDKEAKQKFSINFLQGQIGKPSNLNLVTLIVVVAPKKRVEYTEDLTKINGFC
jgi:hypothetical protein